MGFDKALLELDGKPLWQLQLGKLASIADEILVSLREENPAIAPGYRRVFDADENLGPLSGLLAAFSATAHDHVLLLAVDMPHVTHLYLAEILRLAEPGQGIVPERNGRFEGLCAIFPRSIVPLVESCLSGEDRSFQNLITRAQVQGLMRAIPVLPEDAALFANWNSPADISA